MKDWRPKSAKMAESCRLNAEVIKDLADMVLGSCQLIDVRATKYTEEEAKDKFRRLASLRDQLDQVLPIINRISRVARSLNR